MKFLILFRNLIRKVIVLLRTRVSEFKNFLGYYKTKKIFKKITSAPIKLPLRVAFVVNVSSVWKANPVFEKMVNNPKFHPVIVVIAYTPFGEERMWSEYYKTLNLFQSKGFETYGAYDKTQKRWLQFKEFNITVAFLSIPHQTTFQQYYSSIFTSTLCCYIPYFYLNTTHGNDISLYNQLFHNSMWLNFLPHQHALDRTKDIATLRGQNCLVVGYPACEVFHSHNIEFSESMSIWNDAGIRKKVIWAPHHTIDENKELKLSNFIKISEEMQILAKKYKNQVYIIFKPHPSLKSRLYEHKGWGRERANEYYDFWDNGENTKYHDGNYEELFINSDAMIHDCGSFLIEYLYVKKPVLYLINNYTRQNLNSFGLEALHACDQGKDIRDIEIFIDDLIGGRASYKGNNFFEKEILPYISKKLPSDMIVDIIEKKLGI